MLLTLKDSNYSTILLVGDIRKFSRDVINGEREVVKSRCGSANLKYAKWHFQNEHVNGQKTFVKCGLNFHTFSSDQDR